MRGHGCHRATDALVVVGVAECREHLRELVGRPQWVVARDTGEQSLMLRPGWRRDHRDAAAPAADHLRLQRLARLGIVGDASDSSVADRLLGHGPAKGPDVLVQLAPSYESAVALTAARSNSLGELCLDP